MGWFTVILFFVFYCKFTMTGLTYQMPVIFHKRGTLTPPFYGIFWLWYTNRPFLHKPKI